MIDDLIIIIIIGSGDDIVETRICLPSGGMSYAAGGAAIPSCD